MFKDLIIAHRGVHNNKDIPENSILAFKKALKKKYPIEFDIQLTKDNKLIIFHDNNLKRMTGINKEIQELTYNEVKDIYLLNTKEKIPTFKEVLNLVSGKVLLDIELKNTKRKEKIVELVLEELKNYKGKVILKSFNPLIIKLIKKKTNKYKLGILISKTYDNPFIDFLFKVNIPIKLVKPDFIAINKKLLSEKYYKKMKDKYFIFIWTIKSEDEISKYKMKYLNLSYICNNLE